MNRRKPAREGTWWLLAAFLLLVPAWPNLACGQPGMAPQVGTFLVADEAIDDPRFQQTVILLIRHDLGGTVGLVINQPALADPSRLLPELPDQFEGLFYGGPVAPLNPTVLLRSAAPPANALQVLERTHVIGLDEVLRHLTGGGRAGDAFRIYLGYAGWSPGQLAREIGRGDWQVVPAEEKALFEEDPEALWQRLQQTGAVITI